ncbi:FecR family protein [Elongatibacter sediminis]|uniref:FecR domain-containing protein n=1 Tax=Elongatibacter sediminis TaxID=3119006 RepID=A0AAW9RDK4_9GAMM
MKTCRSLFVILIAGLSAFTSEAFAADATGLIVASRGTVLATGVGEARELKQGDEIFVEDSIMTAPKSFAVIQFLDGAKVTVKPDSEIVIEDYVYNGNADDKATLNLVSGGLRVITGAMAKTHPENYKVKTPVALMGVRGTEFSIQLCGDQVCEQEVID